MRLRAKIASREVADEGAELKPPSWLMPLVLPIPSAGLSIWVSGTNSWMPAMVFMLPTIRSRGVPSMVLGVVELVLSTEGFWVRL